MVAIIPSVREIYLCDSYEGGAHSTANMNGLFKIAFLICFGCGEVKIFGPSEQWRLDMKADLSTLRKKYWKNHPESEGNRRPVAIKKKEKS